jgi:hypothetical protein
MGFGVTIRTPNQVFEFWGGSWLNHCDWWEPLLKSLAQYEGAFAEHVTMAPYPQEVWAKLSADFIYHEPEAQTLLAKMDEANAFGFRHRWENWKKAYALLATEGSHMEIDGVPLGQRTEEPEPVPEMARSSDLVEAAEEYFGPWTDDDWEIDLLYEGIREIRTRIKRKVRRDRWREILSHWIPRSDKSAG